MQTGKQKAAKGFTYLVLCLWALTTIYPFIWVILNSFRKKGLILSDSFSLQLRQIPAPSRNLHVAYALLRADDRDGSLHFDSVGLAVLTLPDEVFPFSHIISSRIRSSSAAGLPPLQKPVPARPFRCS